MYGDTTCVCVYMLVKNAWICIPFQPWNIDRQRQRAGGQQPGRQTDKPDRQTDNLNGSQFPSLLLLLAWVISGHVHLNRYLAFELRVYKPQKVSPECGGAGHRIRKNERWRMYLYYSLFAINWTDHPFYSSPLVFYPLWGGMVVMKDRPTPPEIVKR